MQKYGSLYLKHKCLGILGHSGFSYDIVLLREDSIYKSRSVHSPFHKMLPKLLFLSFSVKSVSLGWEGNRGYPFKLHFQNSLCIPCPTANFPVPIYMICDYYIHNTDLVDLSSLKKIGNFHGKYQNSFYF